MDFNDARTICKSFHIPAAVVDQLENEVAAAAAAAVAAAPAATAAAAVTGGGGHALQTEVEEAEAGPARTIKHRKRTSYDNCFSCFITVCFQSRILIISYIALLIKPSLKPRSSSTRSPISRSAASLRRKFRSVAALKETYCKKLSIIILPYHDPTSN